MFGDEEKKQKGGARTGAGRPKKATVISNDAPPIDDDAAVSRELAKRLTSQRWRLNNLYRIVNAKGHEIPFVMNYAQTLLYLGMWFCNVILKSRQHGITTFICLLYLDICIFNSNMHACIIAHNKEDAADFFQKKILFAYNRLPDLVRAHIKATRESAQSLTFSNGSSIRVTTSGRSGTYQMVHISELGKMCAKYPAKAEEVISGTLNAIHEGQLVTIESTAEGQEGKFFDIVKTAMDNEKDGRKELGKLEFRPFFFGWFDNELNQTQPKNNTPPVAGDAEGDDVSPAEDGSLAVPIYPRISEYLNRVEAMIGRKLTAAQRSWYAQKESVQGELMFREHPSTPEEAFKGSIEGCFYATQFSDLRKNGHICSVPFQGAALVSTWWDLGFNDQNAIWFVQDIGRELHFIHYYENSGEGLLHYKDYLDKMTSERGYKYSYHMAPHDILVHEYTTGVTRLDAAAKMGLPFKIGNRTSEQTQVERSRALLPICWFDREECEKGIIALESYRKEWNPRLGAYKDNPLHNWASHGADAFAQVALMHPFAGGQIIFSQADGIVVKNMDGIHSPVDPRGWT